MVLVGFVGVVSYLVVVIVALRTGMELLYFVVAVALSIELALAAVCLVLVEAVVLQWFVVAVALRTGMAFAAARAFFVVAQTGAGLAVPYYPSLAARAAA